MKNDLFQQIEDFYVNRGYRGDELRKVLEDDKEYKKLLIERKHKLINKLKVTSTENKKYVLSTDEDFEILALCKRIEKLNLGREDKILIQLIKAQLEIDWRRSLLIKLNQILKKYQKK